MKSLHWMKMKTTLTVLLILELYGLSSGLIKQHFFVNMDKTWDSALKYCRTHFHDLSTFTDENEKQQFLADANGRTSDAWVGLHKESGVWKWSGGENATQISWDTSDGQPEDDDCAFLHKSHKKLQNERCNKSQKFFCMTTFVLVQQEENWEGALEYCRTHYNDLASLSSENRMNSALQSITQAQTEFEWTGLRFLAGQWLWVSGDDLDFTAWPQTGQPQCPASNLRCGALGKLTKPFQNLSILQSRHPVDPSAEEEAKEEE
ncbi:C-type lectin lectoxin-Phi1 [Anabarilius grahami]|uniref:C-type lectin lectoxin-Phi1 n=1 Tax=Anabarilius grahami TaxID=495550 RepID=A0A3N0Z507_ANAGA|nr:C-type lectin lectoxin-Phi1 [Anabarilius grahami]